MATKKSNTDKSKNQDTYQMSRADHKHLIMLLEGLNDKMEKRISFKYTFLRGIVRGLGTVVGATIIAALGFAIISSVLDVVDLPIIRDYVNTGTD